MSGEVIRSRSGEWVSRKFAVGDHVRLKHDTPLGVVTDVEMSDWPHGGWLCAYRVHWDSTPAGITKRCHPAQLMPASAPLSADDDDREDAQ